MAPRVGIIGAGLAGICLAAKLQEAGFEDFVVYEKAEEVGGVWFHNTYPGLHCDVPGRAYRYSFEPHPGWTQLFSTGGEVRNYFAGVSRRRGLRSRFRLCAEVVGARWEDRRWCVRLADGSEDEVDVLVSAVGALH